MSSLGLALGFLLVTAVGFAALRQYSRRWPSGFDLALAWVVGQALLTPSVFVAGILGMPITGVGLTILALGLLALLLVLPRSPEGDPQPADSRLPAKPVRFPVILFLVICGLFVWKVSAMPLWSWDHHVIWGPKAKQLVAHDRLTLEFLHDPSFAASRPDYPLGVPLLWRVLSGGAEPQELDFKLLHLSHGLALLVILRRGLQELLGKRWSADLLTAWCASGPLFWDTVSVGLAEMPLALFTLVAAVLIISERRLAPAWVIGWLLGFLPWLKDEGQILALSLVLVSGIAWRGRCAGRWFVTALFWALLWASSYAVATWLLPDGVSFFVGDPTQRLFARLPDFGLISGHMAEFLLIRDNLGFWLIAAGVTLWVLARRRWTASALLGSVWLQLVTYGAVMFLTYVPALAQIDAAFVRITAALIPLGVLGIGFAFRK
jgi:hypothetical protein